MNLEAIKAEMRDYLEVPNTCHEDQARNLITKYWLRLLDQLETVDPSEPLRRVREKVEKARLLFPITGNGHDIDKRDVLAIIDAELKEKKEMKKQKIEIEVEHDEPLEFVRFGYANKEELYLNEWRQVRTATCNHSKNEHIILRPIAPPLELETERFINTLSKTISSDDIAVDLDGDFQIAKKLYLDAAEARDLAALLLRYAETGKLPERVVVKGGKND